MVMMVFGAKAGEWLYEHKVQVTVLAYSLQGEKTTTTKKTHTPMPLEPTQLSTLQAPSTCWALSNLMREANSVPKAISMSTEEDLCG